MGINYGIFLIMGNAGFVLSTVVLALDRPRTSGPYKRTPESSSPTVEARKLEHSDPSALKVKRDSYHYSA